MNRLTEKLTEEFIPELLLAVYRPKDGSYQDCYIESHSIDEKGTVMEGRPLKQETLNAIVDVFFDLQQDSSRLQGLIPENILSYTPLPGGNYKLVWWTPEQIQALHFAESLNLPSGTANVPSMVWVAEKRSLKVYALTEAKRPDLETVMCQAPFYNVDDKGSVCLGSAKVKTPEKTFSSVIDYWHKMFWLSVFTHLSGGNPTKTNVTMLWKRLLEDNNLKWSHLDELIETKGLTLKKILR